MKHLKIIDALQQDRRWINYCPGKPFNLYSHARVSEEQIYTELSILFEAGFRGLSSYGFYNGLEKVPAIAKTIGFEHVIVLLWWPTNELYQLEKNNLPDHIHAVDSLLIGNEAVHKGTTDFITLQHEIASLKSLYNLPVTTGLHRVEHNLHPQLAAETGDYIMYNLQPLWVNIRRDPVDGAGWVKAMYEEIRHNPYLPQNKAVIVHEASWPCGENIPGGFSLHQSYEHQLVFYKTLLDYKIPFIWSFSSDMYFAKIKSPPGGYGGLWTAMAFG